MQRRANGLLGFWPNTAGEMLGNGRNSKRHASKACTSAPRPVMILVKGDGFCFGCFLYTNIIRNRVLGPELIGRTESFLLVFSFGNGQWSCLGRTEQRGKPYVCYAPCMRRHLHIGCSGPFAPSRIHMYVSSVPTTTVDIEVINSPARVLPGLVQHVIHGWHKSPAWQRAVGEQKRHRQGITAGVEFILVSIVPIALSCFCAGAKNIKHLSH